MMRVCVDIAMMCVHSVATGDGIGVRCICGDRVGCVLLLCVLLIMLMMIVSIMICDFVHAVLTPEWSAGLCGCGVCVRILMC